ncbi:MAG: sugar phosphate nucleotidyltransferase [Phycisphaerae bacterium]
MSNWYAVIMAGGSGTRLWPMSRSGRPKQLLKLTPDGKSLLQASVHRLLGLFANKNIFIIAAADHLPAIAENVPEIPPENLIGEPVGRDTANAVGLAAAVLSARDPGCVMGVFTADHLIEPVDRFQCAVKTAFQSVENHPEYLATFGVIPTTPHTGLGYVHRGQMFASDVGSVYKVLAFKEKPNQQIAATYVTSGEYYWNSGMFVWKVSTILNELKTHLPQNADPLIDLGRRFGQSDWPALARYIYPLLKKISIDFAVMEKAKNVLVVELDCRWTDVGSWPELQNITGADGEGNAVLARCLSMIESKHNVIISSQEDHLVALIGVEDFIVVHTPDATLVCPKAQAQQIKNLVSQVEQQYEKKYT